MAKKIEGWVQSSRRRAQRLRQIADEWSPTTSRRVPIPLTSITRICVVVFDDPIDAAVAAPPNWTMGMGEGRVYRRDFSSSEVNAQDPDHSVAVTDLIPSSDPATGAAERVRAFNTSDQVIPADEPIVCVQDSYGDLYTIDPGGGDEVDVVQVNHSSATARDIVEANASNVHPGRIKLWNGSAFDNGDDIWIGFFDYYDVDGGDMIAEQGKYYGPGVLVGTLDVDDDVRPFVICHLGSQTFLGKNSGSEIAKGSSGTIDLWHRQPEVDSNLFVAAKALGAAIPPDKFVTVQRINSHWYVGCYEP